MSTKISIIIPVYNVEQYLRKCLDSCINQTFKDIEIIVVNDCSPDNSDVIMREYEEKYPDLIKCIYLDKNIKLGGARNCGIEIAQGEYIMFVDSDDWIAENMCEEMYNSAKKNNADLVFCDLYKVKNNVPKTIHVLNRDDSVLNASVGDVIGNSINVMACNKLYRRNLIMSSGCLFPENTYYEDNAVVYIWVASADKINYIRKPLYYYLMRENSITNEPKSVANRIQITNALMIFIKNAHTKGLIRRNEIVNYIFDNLCCIIMEFLMYYENYKKENLSFLSDFINENICEWNEILEKSKLNQYEQKIISDFLTNPQYMQALHDRNKTWFSSTKAQKMAIWGNGVWGNNTIAYLKQSGIVPEFVIDSNPELHGTYTQGNIPVVSFDEAKDKCDVIIVAIKGERIYDEITKTVRHYNSDIQTRSFEELMTL